MNNKITEYGSLPIFNICHIIVPIINHKPTVMRNHGPGAILDRGMHIENSC